MTKRVKIIAEVGVNHNGQLALAKKLILAAADCGADIVKFQIFKADYLATNKVKKTIYQRSFETNKHTQLQMLKKLELSEQELFKLNNYCKVKKIKFCASFFETKSLKLHKKLNLKFIKIPSGEITNYFLLKKIGALGKKIILSTGMSNILDIKKAINLLTKSGTKLKNISLLHCNSEYPSPLKDLNLLVIPELKKIFKTEVGYSDHSMSLSVPISAVALGSTIIEKHITLNRNLKGPDHKASFDPPTFKKMVILIRETETSLGKKEKKATKSEKKNIRYVRKFLVASRQIKKNEKFSLKNIDTKRAGKGISPMDIKKILGKKSKRFYKTDEII